MGIFSSQPKEEEEEEYEPPSPTPIKFKGKLSVPIVLLYSYVGTGYHGLQFQDDVLTIEKELLDSISNAGLIPPKSYLNFSQINWREASRTDVGVHAAAQVVSFRVSKQKDMKIRDIAPHISKYLPHNSPIKIWKAISFSANFDAQKFADGRRYQYLMPLHTFKEQTDEHLQYIRDNILPHFIGIKKYHNYTKREKPGSKTCVRTIWEFEISHPFIIEDEKYVLWTIHGQSFMMNQIRKMLATALAVSYDLLSLENLDNTFTEERWALPRLPGDGLYLDKVEYKAQKKKYAKNGATWDVEFDDSRSSIEKWKKTVLYPRIAKLVKETDLFRKWINGVLLEYPIVLQSDERADFHKKRQNHDQ